eukprot:scaffold71620_cov72-Phaeocystis_antarctica.AAC.2
MSFVKNISFQIILDLESPPTLLGWLLAPGSRSWACTRPRASRLRRIRPRPPVCTRPARGRACARRTPASAPCRLWQRASVRVGGPGTPTALGAPPNATPASLRWPRGLLGSSLSASLGAGRAAVAARATPCSG